ncbi:MAG: hybrid sensor histidine kinase/response regulator [Candidatus Aminicenantes bacterium]|nr:MAG: hybrid sensor histidine kinase/response regulator [Candidatus Aminicenantes bacterium]
MEEMDKNAAEHQKPLIFIVEDVPRNLQVLFHILKKGEYRIAAASNGCQALDMIPAAQPDLVLLDIMMPEMDGFEVCRQLKKNPVTADIPIIFLTAKADITDVVKGFEIGAVDYVTKPFNPAELLARVKIHLELKFARETLKDLITARDKFFSIIAHDLRNPLQNLIFSSDLLRNSYDSFDEAERKEYIQRFNNSANQISSLLETLLDWSRVQRGTMELHREKINIAALAADIIDLLKENAIKKNITVSSQIQANTYAFADKNMIGTVIRNLVSNAVKFSNPGGEVKITAKTSSTGNFIEITVSDNGVGIKEEDIAGLFRIDVHKKTRGTANEKGTGLGLLLCKEFVEKNNGSIKVVSTPGKGSDFTFNLPVKPG